MKSTNEVHHYGCHSKANTGILYVQQHTMNEETSVESMDNATVQIFAGLALLIIGLGLGMMLGRRSSPQSQKNREVERKLDQVLQEKKAYEDEVVEHFTDTAKLLNTLTQSYREVHNQLAKGATELCQGQGPVIAGRLEENPEEANTPSQQADVQAPLDYAPKTSPDEKGMLNESFGLDREEAPAQAVEEPVRPQ
jgi:uncharacterized membrane-anchored protein YhcB (DUF1043 family)